MAGEVRHDPNIERALKTHRELAKGTRAAFDKADQAARERGRMFEGRHIDHHITDYRVSQGTDLRGRLRNMLSRFRRPGQRTETARPRVENLTDAERARLRQEFGGQRPGESYEETDRRYDDAARKVVAERGSSQTPGPLPSNETAQRFADKMDTGSTVEPAKLDPDYKHRDVRIHPTGFEPTGDRAKAMHFDAAEGLKKYTESDTGEAPKSSEE